MRLGVHLSTGEKYAVKEIDKKKFALKCKTKDPKSIEDEFKILQSIDHECVIKVKETFDTDDTLYIVMEKASGGELFARILQHRQLPEGIYLYFLFLFLFLFFFLFCNTKEQKKS